GSVIVIGAAGPAPSVGGPRRGAPRLRSACRNSFHFTRRPRGRRRRWVARDEVRPGFVPPVAIHSTSPEGRGAGAVGGWPETRCDPAPLPLSPFIPLHPQPAAPAASAAG